MTYWRIRVAYDNFPLVPPPGVENVYIVFNCSIDYNNIQPGYVHTVFDAIRPIDTIRRITILSESGFGEGLSFSNALAECIEMKLPPNVHKLFIYSGIIESIHVVDEKRYAKREPNWKFHPALRKVLGSPPAQVERLEFKNGSIDDVAQMFDEYGGGNVCYLRFKECIGGIVSAESTDRFAKLISRLHGLDIRDMRDSHTEPQLGRCPKNIDDAYASSQIMRLQFGGTLIRGLIPTRLPPNLKFLEIDPVYDWCNKYNPLLLEAQWPASLECIVIQGFVLKWEDPNMVARFRTIPHLCVRYGSHVPEFVRELVSAPNKLERIRIQSIQDTDLIEILEMEYCNLIAFECRHLIHIDEHHMMDVARRSTRIREIKWESISGAFQRALASEPFEQIQVLLSVRYAPRIKHVSSASLVSEVPWESLIVPMLSQFLPGWEQCLRGLEY